MSQIPILELKTLSDSRALVRICHNRNHLILIEQILITKMHTQTHNLFFSAGCQWEVCKSKVMEKIAWQCSKEKTFAVQPIH